MRHVIIGGCGFTGRHLHRRLLELGEPVLVVDRPQALRDAAPSMANPIAVDLQDAAAVAGLPLGPDDVVHHLAARQFHGAVPRRGRADWFAAVNVAGTQRLLERMARTGCRRMIYFSSDMVYGLPAAIPVRTDQPRRPLGPYGASKRLAEDLCFAFRRNGMSITVFRPRLIVGPGRLGVLAKLFGLIQRGLPVPLIGKGRNCYQMISVLDCVTAIEAALARGVPNDEFNLGSRDPPPVRELLAGLIAAAGSRSRLLPLPAMPLKQLLTGLDAVGLTVLHPEQFRIADLDFLVDISRTVDRLDWSPTHGDAEMMAAAYAEFRAGAG